jgi:hypothetical protein
MEEEREKRRWGEEGGRKGRQEEVRKAGRT